MSAGGSIVDLARRATRALEEAGFTYSAVGAFARNAWARPRATTDADLALALEPEQVPALRELVASLGLRVRRERPDEAGGAVPELLLLEDRADPVLRLDLLIARTPFEESALARRKRAVVAGFEMWVASPEDLLVYKLVAGRPRDWADAEEVARTVALRSSVDWPYVERWMAVFGLAGRLIELRARLGTED